MEGERIERRVESIDHSIRVSESLSDIWLMMCTMMQPSLSWSAGEEQEQSALHSQPLPLTTRVRVRGVTGAAVAESQLLKPKCAMTLGTREEAASRLGRMRRANEHWTLQTESFRISEREKDFARLRQFLIFSELHMGCRRERERERQAASQSAGDSENGRANPLTTRGHDCLSIKRQFKQETSTAAAAEATDERSGSTHAFLGADTRDARRHLRTLP